MNQRISVSLLSLLCLASTAAAQGDVDMRTTAKKGVSVWLAQETKSEQEVQGQEMTQEVTRVIQVTVKDVDDKGNLVVETKIVRIHGNVSTPMGENEFDSAAADKEGEGGEDMAAMMTKSLSAGAGKTFVTKVSPFGKVIEMLDGTAELLKAREGGMMGGPTMDEGTMKQMVEGAFGLLPDKAVAVGGKWQNSETGGKSRMPIEQKMELTLAKADADAFEITATGTVVKPEAKKDDAKKPAKGDDEQGQMEAMVRDLKISNGKMSGKLHISRKDGLILDATMTMSMDMEINSPMGEMTFSNKVTIATKRVTEAAAAPAKKAPAKDDKKEEKKEGGK